MLSLLPLLSFVFLFFLIYQNHKIGLKCWRTAFLMAAVGWGVLIDGGAEILNLFHAVDFPSLTIFWAIATLSLFCGAIKSYQTNPSATQFQIPHLTRFQLSIFISMAFIVIVAGLIAFITPPNNSDAMVYHMSRVAHWIQNHSINHYVTSITKQLWKAPWAELAIMHFQILSHSDRWANFIQWFSMVGCLIGTSLIARQLGAGLTGQWAAAAVTASIPMGVLQAPNTQNDYVMSFWLVCFVYFILLDRSEKNWCGPIFLGLSLALTVFTQEPGYLYSIPFFLWWIIQEQKKVGWKKIWRPIGLIFCLAFLVNAGHYARNFDLYKNPLSPPHQDNLPNETWSPQAIVSNVVRNVGLQLGSPFEAFSQANIKIVQKFHDLLKININDPQTTFAFGYDYIVDNAQHPFQEQVTGNFLHTIILIGCLFALCFLPAVRNNKILRTYTLLVTLAFLFFNIYLKWSAFNSRVLLGVYILYSPLIAVTLSSLKRPWLAGMILWILILGALPWLFFNEINGIATAKNIFNTPRLDQYFSSQPGFEYSCKEAVQYIQSKGCSQIGLDLAEENWEYPIWAMFQNDPKFHGRIEHINVANETSRFAPHDFEPCAIIGSKTDEDLGEIILNNRHFVKTKIMYLLDVFLPDENGQFGQRSILFRLTRMIKDIEDIEKELLANQTKENPQTLIRLIDAAKINLKKTQIFDPQKLNEIYSGLGNAFTTLLVQGLETLTVGYDSKDNKKFREGQILMFKWSAWVAQNGNAVTEKILEQKLK